MILLQFECDPEFDRMIDMLVYIPAALLTLVLMLNELWGKKPLPKNPFYYIHLLIRSFIKTAVVFMVCGFVLAILGFIFFFLVFS